MNDLKKQQVTARLLAEMIRQRLDTARFGLRARNLPPFDAATLVESLRPELSTSKLRLALLGYELPSNPNPERITAQVEEAVAWRNDEEQIPIIVLLNPQQPHEKVHSLEMLEPVKDEEFRRNIAQQGRKRNQEPQMQILWQVLARKRDAERLALVAEQVAAFYTALEEGTPAAEALPYLGLLRDPDLFTDRGSRDKLASRLRTNFNRVKRLHLLEKKDIRALARALGTDPTRFQPTFAAVQQFTQNPTFDTLDDPELILGKVQDLFDAPKAPEIASAEPDDVEEPDPSSILESASEGNPVLSWMFSDNEEEQQLLDAFAAELNDLYREDASSEQEPNWEEKEDQTVNYLMEQGIELKDPYPKKTERHPLETWMRRTVQHHVWGGVINARSDAWKTQPLPQILAEDNTPPPFYPRQPFQEQTADSSESLHYLLTQLDRVLKLDDTSLAGALEKLDDARRKLTDYRMRFLYHPKEEARVIQSINSKDLRQDVASYIEAYERLAHRLQDVYRRALEHYPDTIEQATAQFLALDTIIISRRGGDALLLTTLHPLHLWKWLDLACRLEAHKEVLDKEEQKLLVDQITHLPTLLNTFTLHPAMFPIGPFGGRYHLEEPRLVLAGEISNPSSTRTVGVPFYQPATRSTAGGEGFDRTQLSSLLKDFLVLYPPARFSLSLAVVDPPAVRPFLEACQHLAEAGLLDGARIQVYRTDPDAVAYEARTLDNDDILELFRNNPRWTFQVNLQVNQYQDQYQEIANQLQAQGCHVVILCNPSEAIVQPLMLTSQGQTSPFGVPVHLVYDAIRDTVRRVPAPVGGLFDVYAGVRNALSNELSRRTFGVSNRLALTDRDLQALSKSGRWFAVLDHPNGTLELPKLGHQWLWQPTGNQALTISSHDDKRWQSFLSDLRRRLPVEIDETLMTRYLHEALLLLPKGLLTTLTDPSKEGDEVSHEAVSETHTQALLAVLTTFDHYRRLSPTVTLFSLDSAEFARTFGLQPSSDSFARLLAVWHEEGKVCFDLIVARTFNVPSEQMALPMARKALEPLHAPARRLASLFAPDVSETLLGPMRQEVLRDQMSIAVFAPAADDLSESERAERLRNREQWATVINQLFSEYQPQIRLRAIHVVLNERSILPVQPLEKEPFPQEVIQLQPPVQSAPSDAPQEREPSMFTSETVQELGDQEEQVLSSPSSSELLSPQPQTTPEGVLATEEQENIEQQADDLRRVLTAYGIAVAGVDVEKTQVGPRLVRYWVRLQPPAGRLSEMQKYAVDIARELGSRYVPLIDNIPGEQYVGVDLLREEPQIVPFAPALAMLPIEQPHSLMLALGVNAAGKPVQADLVPMPHLLVAGSTGSGKTMFLSTLITSLAMRHPPDDLQLMLVDPKQTDFIVFDQLPHLWGGRILYDPSEAIKVLRGMISDELEARTALLTDARCPNNLEYNRRHPTQRIPWLVVVVDEFADIILTLSKKERATFERQIGRLAAIGRAKGIHLVLATQRPTTDVITGTIKTNFTARISFRLPSLTDSRTILDQGGAEHLLGQGDMLVQLDGELQRLQGYYAPYDEVMKMLSQIPTEWRQV